MVFPEEGIPVTTTSSGRPTITSSLLPGWVRYSVRCMRRLYLVAALVVAAGVVAAAAAAGHLARTGSAAASATHRYVMRLGDKVAIPALGQTCSLQREGGAVDLFCARPRQARHQVTIFRDRILVWKVGKPDHPVWAGKP